MTRMFACLAMGAACAAMGCAQIAGIEDTRGRADSGPPAIDAGLPAIDASLPSCEPDPIDAEICPGRLLEQIQLKHGTALFGYLEIYYDDASGINCAMTRAAGSVQGNESWIEVELRRCIETEPGNVCTEDAVVCDYGTFKLWAGPVVLQATDQCINARGTLTYDGQTVTATTDPIATRCLP